MKTAAWGLTGAEVREVFDMLRFDFCKWDVYTRGSAWHSAQNH